ncbi:hypothetical protein roselon_02809 [Roseibacterium elongatum DSM 19469]|uniref:Uncharacterized protein n=1 Tax=Roseicyclus elongatus DSM 19469 TaxID=1294273 RepID=W8S4H6_9RHOB|nr:hypothetical protein [Roseibacterium elongatum]AHM05107.1 hypothetical protein roselon_02809 [Roseibacterium elongatum DSM 19469]
MAQTDTHRPVALSPAAWTRPHPAQRRRRTVAFGLVAAILAIMAFGALKALAPVAIPVIFVSLRDAGDPAA